MKKFLAVILCLALLVSTVAFAESVSSKTSEDMVQVVTDNDAIALVLSGVEGAEGLADVIADIAASDADGAAVAYFEANASAEATAQLKEVFGDEQVEISEAFSAMTVLNGHDPVQLTVDITMPTAFAVNQKVALAFGAKNTDAVDWTIVPASVNEDGSLAATLSEDLVKTLSEKECVMLVLNTVAE